MMGGEACQGDTGKKRAEYPRKTSQIRRIFIDRTGAENLGLTASGSPYGSPLHVSSACSTSRTLRASASGVKGFFRKAVPSSTTPRRIRASSA
jgi:hypothetical protein